MSGTTYPPVPRVERKVKVGAALAYLGGVAALAATNAVGDAIGNTTLITDLPDWLEVVVVPMLPAAFSALGGFIAKHTPRPDLPSAQR